MELQSNLVENEQSPLSRSWITFAQPFALRQTENQPSLPNRTSKRTVTSEQGEWPNRCVPGAHQRASERRRLRQVSGG